MRIGLGGVKTATFLWDLLANCFQSTTNSSHLFIEVTYNSRHLYLPDRYTSEVKRYVTFTGVHNKIGGIVYRRLSKIFVRHGNVEMSNKYWTIY